MRLSNYAPKLFAGELDDYESLKLRWDRFTHKQDVSPALDRCRSHASAILEMDAWMTDRLSPDQWMRVGSSYGTNDANVAFEFRVRWL